jgi:hypothetical protein
VSDDILYFLLRFLSQNQNKVNLFQVTDEKRNTPIKSNITSDNSLGGTTSTYTVQQTTNVPDTTTINQKDPAANKVNNKSTDKFELSDESMDESSSSSSDSTSSDSNTSSADDSDVDDSNKHQTLATSNNLAKTTDVQELANKTQKTTSLIQASMPEQRIVEAYHSDVDDQHKNLNKFELSDHDSYDESDNDESDASDDRVHGIGLAVCNDLVDDVISEGIKNELCIEFADDLYRKEIDSLIDDAVECVSIELYKKMCDRDLNDIVDDLINTTTAKHIANMVNEIYFYAKSTRMHYLDIEEEVIVDFHRDILKSCIYDARQSINGISSFFDEQSNASAIQSKMEHLDLIFSTMCSKEFIEPISRRIPLRTCITEEEQMFVEEIDELVSPAKEEISRTPIKHTPSKEPLSTKSPIPNRLSNLNTRKDQLKFLNSFKKSENPLCATKLQDIDLVSIIKEKKRLLDENLTQKFKDSAKLAQLKSTMPKSIIPQPIQTTFEGVKQSSPNKQDIKRKRESTSAHDDAEQVTKKPCMDHGFMSFYSKSAHANQNISPKQIKDDTDYIKTSLATYFRKFNVKVGFTFDELEKCIVDLFVNTSNNIKVDVFVLILIKVFIHYLFFRNCQTICENPASLVKFNIILIFEYFVRSLILGIGGWALINQLVWTICTIVQTVFFLNGPS